MLFLSLAIVKLLIIINCDWLLLGQQHLAIGPYGYPIQHITQIDTNYCGAAAVAMIEKYEQMWHNSQQFIMAAADANGSNNLSLTEMKYYLNFIAGIPCSSYTVPTGNTADENEAILASMYSQATDQNVTPIVPVAGPLGATPHVVVVAGYTDKCGTPDYIIFQDPAGAGTERDLSVHVTFYKFAQQVGITFIEGEYVFFFISQPFYLQYPRSIGLPGLGAQDLFTDMNTIPKSTGGLYDDSNRYVRAVTKNRPELQPLPPFACDHGNSWPVPDSIWLESTNIADSALATLLDPANLELWYINELYQHIITGNYSYGDIILTSSTQFEWDDVDNSLKALKSIGNHPGIYMRIVEIMNGDDVLIGVVLLLHNEPSNVLAIIGIPPKPEEMQYAKATGNYDRLYHVCPEDIYKIYGNWPMAWNSYRSFALTGCMPMSSLPIWITVDASTTDTVYMDYFGHFLYLDDNGFFKMNGQRFKPLRQIGANNNPLPSEFSLAQNYPNPFNSETIISFDLQKAGHVKLNVYNITGQLVTILADDYYEAGRHMVTWDGSECASGVYFYRITKGIYIESKKMILLK